jgi:predicted nucleotidyltransferase
MVCSQHLWKKIAMVTKTDSDKKTVEEAKKKLVSQFGRTIDSIVLYGSAARGQYRPMESDIDILVIGRDDNGLINSEISGAIGSIDLDNATATSLVYISRENFRRHLEWDSPFLENVLEEGITLYDNGTFEKVRRSLIKAGR